MNFKKIKVIILMLLIVIFFIVFNLFCGVLIVKVEVVIIGGYVNVIVFNEVKIVV